VLRGGICGLMTALGGIGHTLPYLVPGSNRSAFWIEEIAAFETVIINKIARLWLVEIIAHGFEERLDGKWFRKIRFASALPDFFLVLFHGKAGNGDHRNMAQMFVLLDPLGDLKSGNVGQLNIHHYEIGFVQAREFQRFDAAAARQRLIAMHFQKIAEQLQVQLIVFHDQNTFLHRKNPAPRGGRSCGRFRKRKVMIIEFLGPWRESVGMIP
jgi:hypothetical protein